MPSSPVSFPLRRAAPAGAARRRVPPGAVLAIVAALLLAAACDRNIEPYADEPVREPDLSRIFPEGAERAAEAGGGPGGAAGAEGPPGGPAPPPAPEGAASAAPGADAEPLRGTVRLAPEVEEQAPSGGVLFLIARTAQGGPPTAVKRIPSPRFPLEFELGPDDRMLEGMPFTGPFRVSVRLDADGNAATRSPGDLQGEADALHGPGDRGIEVVIDEAL